MIAALNELVTMVDEDTAAPVDVDAVAARHGTTGYHLRRMFSSLAGMPLSDYVRRRRMTLAATDLIRGAGDLLSIGVRHGYGSVEAFSRAFRAVHGAGPTDVRRDGGPLRAQARLQFRLTVGGSSPMNVRIVDRPAFRLAGHAARVPLVHQGVNSHIQQHVAALSPAEHQRLKALGNTEPAGLLAVSDGLDPDRAEGSELLYLHGVAVTTGTETPTGLDIIDVEPGTWAVFTVTGPYPAALQDAWAATATDWFPSNGWRARPGPEIVAVLERSDDFSTATCELWLPVEPE